MLALCAAPAILGGCTTVPPPSHPITAEERKQRDQAVGSEIARQFDEQFEFREDREVSAYLKGLASALADATPELRSAPMTVLVVRDRGGKWQDFALPGHRIYLSSGVLKRMDFENQVAAAIAFELAHIVHRHALTRLQEGISRETKAHDEKAPGSFSAPGPSPADYPSIEGLVPSASKAPNRPVEFLGPDGIFAFPDESEVEAAETAVDIMYRAGYDPRGLVSLWGLYEASPARSPFGKDLVQKLLEKTRRVIALRSPLRNPIVRSQAFLMVHKRIQSF